MKPAWLKEREFLTDDQIDFIDWQYRSRLQALLGVDEMVQDIFELLEKKGELDSTYRMHLSRFSRA